MVGIASRKTRLIAPEKTRKANLNWAVRQTLRERAVSLFVSLKKKNRSDDGSMDNKHNSLTSGIVGIIVSMD